MHSLRAQTSADMFDLLVDLALQQNLVSIAEIGYFRKASSVLRQEHKTISQVAEELVLELGCLLVDRWGGPAVGAVLAMQADLSRLGTMGELVRRSETPQSAFALLVRFNRLLNQRSTFELHNTPFRTTMTHKHISVEAKHAPAAQFGTVWALANVALIPKHVFGCALLPLSATFEFPAPDNLDPIHRVFGPSVQFGQQKASVTFDRARLKDIRNPVSMPLFKALESAAEKGLDQIPLLDSLAAHIRHHIIEHMAGSMPQQSAVAALLGLSVRSMQRKLAQEGTSFRQVVDDVRCETARHLLADERISLSEIAFRLGYSEQAAFNHAAERWFGKPPRAVRKMRAKE